MNGKRIAVVSAALAALLAVVAGTARASEQCSSSLEVRMGLLARFVTLPDAPAFEARGEGRVCYELDGEGAVILGASVPRLIFHGDDVPGGLGEITAFVDAMPGVDPKLSWKNFPEVKLVGVDFRVRAYQGSPAGIGPDSETLVDVIVPRISFSTGLIEVEGWESFGYLDQDTLTAMLVGSAKLPPHSYPPYSEWLAGEPVLLELTVQIRNPYSKD